MNDQQAAEYMAGIESGMQAVRWATPVAYAITMTDGLAISGDHRPRIGRRRLGQGDVAQYREDEGLPPSALWLWIRHPRHGAR